MTKIELRGVRKSFGAFEAIRQLDLLIETGELVALLGPSGCGKTTTLRLIAGLEAPTAGAILFDGADVSKTSVQDRNVGLVSQRFALFPHMNAERNIAFGLEVRGYAREEIRDRVEELLDMVQLRAFRDRFPSQLSVGQMQRVAIARTLATRPAILMLDEPLANLDASLRAEMRSLIRDLQRRFAITTIFVTHDQAEAMELADQVAVLLDGRLAQFDRPETLYRKPGSLAVARFMGMSNIFPAALTEPRMADTAIGRIHMKEPAGIRLGASGHIVLRAEAIDILEEPPDGTRPYIPGVVVDRTFTGASVGYRVACGEAHINVSGNSRRLLDIGSKVWLDISPEGTWFLPD